MVIALSMVTEFILRWRLRSSGRGHDSDSDSGSEPNSGLDALLAIITRDWGGSPRARNDAAIRGQMLVPILGFAAVLFGSEMVGLEELQIALGIELLGMAILTLVRASSDLFRLIERDQAARRIAGFVILIWITGLALVIAALVFRISDLELVLRFAVLLGVLMGLAILFGALLFATASRIRTTPRLELEASRQAFGDESRSVDDVGQASIPPARQGLARVAGVGALAGGTAAAIVVVILVLNDINLLSLESVVAYLAIPIFASVGASVIFRLLR